MWRTNVAGTSAFTDQLQSGARLRRFLYVGTAYCCGAVSGRVVREDDLAAPDHVAAYTRSKFEAEAMLEARTGLPLLVARPSVVIGHSVLGVKPSASLFWYYRALAQAGICPFPDDKRRDVVPVDHVAGALVHLTFLQSPRHHRYHISAGESSAVRWGDLYAEFVRHGAASGQCRQVLVAALSRHPALSSISGGDRYFRLGLEACARFSALSIEWFANEHLLSEGVAPPPPLTHYLGRCLETSDRSVLEQMHDDA